MATDLSELIDQALTTQLKLQEQGLLAEAKVVEQLVAELTALRPNIEKPFYTSTEAALMIGVTAQTVKNWVNRGIIKGYKLGSRTVIPRAELDDYRVIAEASQAIEPLPSRGEVVDEIRKGRRPIVWPKRGAGG